MRGEQQSSPLRLELEEQVLGAGARLGVQAAHRFVENVKIALRKKAGGKSQFLGHALGIGADRLVESGDVQVERSEHRANALIIEPASEQLKHYRSVFESGVKAEGVKPLAQERHPGTPPHIGVGASMAFS